MTPKEFIADYLTFSRKDRLGIIVLLMLLSLIFILQKFKRNPNSTSTLNEQLRWLDTPEGRQFLDSINNHYALLEERVKSSHTRYEADKYERRYKKSGAYSNSYQQYKQPSFLVFKDSRAGNLVGKDKSRIRAGPGPAGSYHRMREGEIDINDADSSMLVALPGIGSKLAGRILKFREKLGGFYSIEQIGETFGLPDSTFQMIRKYLTLQNHRLKKININTAGEDELKSHPYIRWNVSSPIITYRNEHGPFQKLEDLKNVLAVTDEIYGRLFPYLMIE